MERAAASMASAMPTPWVRSRSGSSCTWTWRTSPPNTATFDTPGHREHPWPKDPVDEGPLVHGRDRIGRDADDEHGAGRGGERRQDRWLHRLRQPDRHFAEPLRQRLARLVDIHPLAQHRGHHGQSLDGLRPHGGDALHAVDRVLDRLGDLELDLLRREAGRLGLDGYLGRRELREDVERGAAERIRPLGHEDEREPEHDRSMPDGSSDQRCQHARRRDSLAGFLAHRHPRAELLRQQLLGAVHDHRIARSQRIARDPSAGRGIARSVLAHGCTHRPRGGRTSRRSPPTVPPLRRAPGRRATSVLPATPRRPGCRAPRRASGWRRGTSTRAAA